MQDKIEQIKRIDKAIYGFKQQKDLLIEEIAKEFNKKYPIGTVIFEDDDKKVIITSNTLPEESFYTYFTVCYKDGSLPSTRMINIIDFVKKGEKYE